MPFITNIIRDYANVNDSGVPFDGPGFHNGGSTSIINQGGGDDWANLDWVLPLDVFIDVLLLLLVSFLVWRVKYRRNDGAGGPGIFQRLREAFGRGGNGHQGHELGSIPPDYPHTDPGRSDMAKSEGSLPP